MKRNLAIILVIILMMLAPGCKRQVKKQAVVAKPVVLMTVMDGEFSNSISFSGNVKPSKTVKIAFKVAGTIENIMVNEGDYVRRGQLLAKLDAHQYELNKLAAESNYTSLKLKVNSEIPSAINQAKSQLDLITSRYERYKKLYENGTLPKDKFEQLETEMVVIQNKYQEALDAKAVYAKKLEQARALSELAVTNVSDCSLHSPINGVVVKKLTESGELAGVGYPILVLGELEQIEVEIGVSDEQIGKLKLGQTAVVYIYGIEESFNGVITEIGAMADEKTRTFPVKIAINNQLKQLKPGMIAKVTLPLGTSSTLLVPVDAVMNMADGPRVFVYSAKTKSVVAKAVITGNIIKDQVEIVSGLLAGEQIVINGQFKLKNHDRVKVEATGK